MFKQDAGDLAVLAAILTQNGVFELQHVDLLEHDLLVDEVAQIGDVELAHGVRLRAAEHFACGFPTDDKFDGFHHGSQRLVGF